jgi:hypothetical protein
LRSISARYRQPKSAIPNPFLPRPDF